MLLDTHIFLAIVEDDVAAMPVHVRRILETSNHKFFLSTASLWEIAIKHRLGKLPLSARVELLTTIARSYGIDVISINEHHALHHVEPEPPTRDPFDRMLLAQCAVEGLKLVTVDAALSGHPLSATAPQK